MVVIHVRQGVATDGGFIINNNVHVTKRELETLADIGMGMDNAGAAKKNGVSANTVRNHIWNVMQKLGATSRANAVALAVENGLFEILRKRSLKTFVRGYDRYLLCIFCGKVNHEDEYSEEKTEQVTINHINYDMQIIPTCPTQGCTGNITETIDWRAVRMDYPDYPEKPEHDVKYDFNMERYPGYSG